MKESTSNKMKVLMFLLFCFLLANGLMADNKNTPTKVDEGFVWKSQVPEDCPFDQSPTLTGIRFTRGYLVSVVGI
ncbi:MAG: hypothetical protein ACYTEX_22995 [Planctomycetota bacterium]